MTYIKFHEDVARAWLETQRVDTENYQYNDQIDVEITSTWSPRYDLDDTIVPHDVWMLVHYAGEQPGVFTTDDGARCNVVFVYDDDSDGGAAMWIAELAIGAGPSVLKVASPLREYRKLGDPEAQGVDAAIAVLKEAEEGANEALTRLRYYMDTH